jgi:hypothetical protein
MIAINLADVVNAADVPVRHLASHTYFTMETGKRGAISQQILRQEFEGHRLAKFKIVGAIDFAHAAFAQ